MHGRIKRGGAGVPGPNPPGKSLVAIGVLRNIGIETPLEKQLDPFGPIVSQGRL